GPVRPRVRPREERPEPAPLARVILHRGLGGACPEAGRGGGVPGGGRAGGRRRRDGGGWDPGGVPRAGGGRAGWHGRALARGGGGTAATPTASPAKRADGRRDMPGPYPRPCGARQWKREPSTAREPHMPRAEGTSLLASGRTRRLVSPHDRRRHRGAREPAPP